MAETQSAPSLREWVMVPRVPTTEMRRAMARACTLGWDIGDYTWEQGLAAAPTPPTTLTEAVSAARAEGVREGLEQAAVLHETVEIARLCALLTEAVGALQPFAGAAAEEHMRFVKNEQRLFLETMSEVCITRDIRGGDLRRAQSALENLTSGLALTAQEQMEKLAKELGTSGTAETFRAALAVAKQAASEARATLANKGHTDD